MKKIIIVVLIVFCFAGLSIGITAVLIQAKNNENIKTAQKLNNNENINIIQNSKNEINNNIESNTINKQNEKTINLRGTYSENDLIIEEVICDAIKDQNDEKAKIPQISGLKNKQIQEKINVKIKNSINDKLKNIVNNNSADAVNFVYEIKANFANVLSVYFNIYSSSGKVNDTIRLNYKLTNGEELKFEELFKQDEDFRDILRIALYRKIAEMQRGEQSQYKSDNCRDIHYDNEKGAWYATYKEYDENGNIKEIIKEYVPPISEYEIEKMINKFLKQENKKFSFSPSLIEIEFDDLSCSIELKDIADKIVIYDKFLTLESLYEKDNIGAKSVVACSAEYNLGKYKEAKYESDNFFYDICLQPENDGGTNPFRDTKIEDKYKFLEEKMEEAKILLNDEVEKYKNIAKNNPNKAYFLFSKFVFAEYKDKNQLVGESKSKIIVCDIEEKEEVLEKILSCYRYYHIYYYGTICEYIDTKEELKKFMTEESEIRYYDTSNGKEYNIQEN